MVAPGEINQAIGHAYQYVFTGALEATVPPFSCSVSRARCARENLVRGVGMVAHFPSTS